jgi:pantothenate synthetase
MQDNPTAINLLQTIQDLLIKEIAPKLEGEDFLSYKTLVSWNMLGVVVRELKFGEKLLHDEMIRLRAILNKSNSNSELTYQEKIEEASILNRELAQLIRNAKLDNKSDEVWNLVKQSLKEKISITNPRFSLEE